MTRVNAIIRNANGIHCRPSAIIIREASSMTSELHVHATSGKASLRSMIDLLALGLAPGDEITISAEGPDELLAVARLQELFERRFDFPPRTAGETDAIVLAGY